MAQAFRDAHASAGPRKPQVAGAATAWHLGCVALADRGKLTPNRVLGLALATSQEYGVGEILDLGVAIGEVGDEPTPEDEGWVEWAQRKAREASASAHAAYDQATDAADRALKAAEDAAAAARAASEGEPLWPIAFGVVGVAAVIAWAATR